MSTSSGVYTSIEQLQEILLRYAEVVTDCLPPRHVRLVQSNDVEWRNVSPAAEEEDEGEMVIEVKFREVYEVPDGTHEERMRDVFSRISVDDVVFNLQFNALMGLWMFSYLPDTEIGIEVRGRQMEDVVNTVIELLQKRIAFATGDVYTCIRDLDRELLELPALQDDTETWF